MSADLIAEPPHRASEGADGPVARVALGIRFELYNDADELFAAVLREDVKGAAVPRAGECIARGALSTDMHELVGLDPCVDHVDHYVSIPGCRDGRDPLTMVVIRVPATTHQVRSLSLDLTQTLEAEGWYVRNLRI